MKINMKYNYPAWKWVATQLLLPLLWGILQKQTFHFHSLMEDDTSYSLIHISSPQKPVFIINWKRTSLLPAQSLTDRAARFSPAEACWQLTDEQNFLPSCQVTPGVSLLWLGGSALTGQAIEVSWLHSSWSLWWLCCVCWSPSWVCPELVGLGCYLSLFLAMGSWPYNLAPVLGPNR